jgi:hypothetical protein
LILPGWRWQVWSRALAEMTVTSKVLGQAAAILTRGTRMAKVRADLPPGLVVAVLADTRLT